MTLYELLIGPVAALAAALTCLAWQPIAQRLGFIDYPSRRSLHDHPKIRAAGLPAGLALAAVLVVWSPNLPTALLAALVLAAILMGVSTLDDRKPLPIVPRLGTHLLVCFGFVALVLITRTTLSGIWLAAGIPIIGLALAWMTNLYNFMDGSDGLAGGQAVIGFLALAAMADTHGVPVVAVPALAIAGAAAGFLVWNRPPARMFLGDAGAIPLGFLAGAFGLLLVIEAGISPWLAMLPFAPFWLDASVTLARRILKGEQFWKPHREHAYQALVRSGLGHGRTALVAYGLMLFCAVAAVAGTLWPSPVAGPLVLLGCLAVLAGVGVWAHRRLAATHSS